MNKAKMMLASSVGILAAVMATAQATGSMPSPDIHKPQSKNDADHIRRAEEKRARKKALRAIRP